MIQTFTILTVMMDTEACKNFLEKKYLLLLRQPILEARKQYLALQPPPKKWNDPPEEFTTSNF